MDDSDSSPRMLDYASPPAPPPSLGRFLLALLVMIGIPGTICLICYWLAG